MYVVSDRSKPFRYLSLSSKKRARPDTATRRAWFTAFAPPLPSNTFYEGTGVKWIPIWLQIGQEVI
jgi:hypothetical protein